MTLCSECGKDKGVVHSKANLICPACAEARLERYRKVVQAILNGKATYRQSYFWNMHYIGTEWPLWIEKEIPELAARLIATENALAVLPYVDIKELFDVL